EVLEAVPLKLIGCCRGDPVNVDLALATRKGIPVFHAPGRNADAVADLTVAFLLMLARHLGPMRDTFREGAARITDAGGFLAMYNRFTGVELGGRTVGLVALGAVGREVAARLGAFKARVLAYDPYVTAAPPGVELGPARAALADEDALYAMLRDGRLAGAALDVLAEEPLQPDNRFLALPNVIVTPHIGGATVDVARHQSEIVVDAIERHLRGERPRWVANPAVLERPT